MWCKHMPKACAKAAQTWRIGVGPCESGRATSPLAYLAASYPVCEPAGWYPEWYLHRRVRACMLPCRRACILAFHTCMLPDIHACLLPCVHVCVHACAHACMLACMLPCVLASVHACVRRCVRVCFRTCVCVCVNARVRACMRTCEGRPSGRPTCSGSSVTAPSRLPCTRSVR